MKFTTAIFYDIENLIGGYGTRMEDISEFSLKDIHESICKIDIVEGIAIQRAYANWSDARLSVMRGDIVELGIDPVQMFGFGRGTQKNASDIQLAIDAIDVAFSRPTIDVFVIVSGDGGFSALAKKLHEYGRSVVGCAYRYTTNKVFEAVCDRFIWISQPDTVISTPLIKHTDPILKKLESRVKQKDSETPEDYLKCARDIMEQIGAFPESRELLHGTGMNISIISQALSIGIRDFSYTKAGHIRLVDFLRYVLHGTKLQLMYHAPSDYRIVAAGVRLSGFEVMTTIPADHQMEHSLDNYRTLLGVRAPVLKLPSLIILHKVAQWLCAEEVSIDAMNLIDLLERIVECCQVDQCTAKETILAFVETGAFLLEPDGQRLAMQTLTFKKQTAKALLETLRGMVRKKLVSLLGRVNESLIELIV